MKTKRLKKIRKKQDIKDSQEAFRLDQIKKSQVIAKVKKKIYYEFRAEICNSSEKL